MNLTVHRATGLLSLESLLLEDIDIFTSSPGLFDECVAVEGPSFQGQYCSLFFEMEDKETILLPRVGFCIPSSGSAKDLRVSVAQLITDTKISNRSLITDENYCFTRKKIDSTPEFDGPDIAVM